MGWRSRRYPYSSSLSPSRPRSSPPEPTGRACSRHEHPPRPRRGGLRSAARPGHGAAARAAHHGGHRGGRRGGGSDGHRQRGPGGPVGPCCRLAGGGRAHGAAREREGARVRLGGRQRNRDLPGPRPHPRHGVGPRHRHADAGERDHGLQHLLQRPGPPHGRVPVRRRREQERPARRHRPDAHLRPEHQYVEPWAEHGGWTLVPERHPPVATGRC